MMSHRMMTLLMMVGVVQANLNNLYTAQSTATGSTLYAAATIASTFGNVQTSVAGAWGRRNVGLTGPAGAMQLDTAARMGSVMEIVVVAAALLMPEISNNLNNQVNVQYMPNRLPLLNPARSTSPITYQMLMQHTSTLTDDLYYNGLTTTVTCSGATCTGSSTQTFAQFMQTTFSAASVGSATLTSTIFTATATPGQVASYSYAHINTALLLYIMDQIVAAGTVTVQSTSKTAGSWIYEQILQPLGMSSTFFLLPDGRIPQTGNQVLSALLNSMLLDFDASGNQRWMTHPNIYGDVMGFSTVLDLQRLATRLLAVTASCTTALCAVGRRMRQQKITVTGRLYQNGMGLGVMFYNPVSICSATRATTAFTTCPLTGTSEVWGHVTGGTRTDLASIAGVVCTSASGANTAVPSCVSIVQGRRNTGTPHVATNAFEMIGGAFQQSFGETTVVSTSGRSSSDDLYGLWVILGVAGTVVFVLAASYFTEFLIQPPPPVGPGPFRPPQQPQVAENFQPPPPQF